MRARVSLTVLLPGADAEEVNVVVEQLESDASLHAAALRACDAHQQSCGQATLSEPFVVRFRRSYLAHTGAIAGRSAGRVRSEPSSGFCALSACPWSIQAPQLCDLGMGFEAGNTCLWRLRGRLAVTQALLCCGCADRAGRRIHSALPSEPTPACLCSCRRSAQPARGLPCTSAPPCHRALATRACSWFPAACCSEMAR